MNRREWLVSLGGAASTVLLPASAAADTESSGFATNFDGMVLRDQEDRPFRLSSLAGEVCLFNFVFAGCATACPLQVRILAEVQRSLAPDVARKVRFVSFSLDPLGDTPAALKSFARRMEADLRRWSFVTGRPQDIDRLAERLRLFRTASGARQLGDHSTALWLSDARGRLVQRFSGNPPDAARLRDELTVFARA